MLQAPTTIASSPWFPMMLFYRRWLVWIAIATTSGMVVVSPVRAIATTQQSNSLHSNSTASGITPFIAQSSSAEARREEAERLFYQGAQQLNMGQYAEAISSLQRSLSLQRELNNLLGVAYVLYGLGRVYAATGQYAQALEHYQQALVIFLEPGVREASLQESRTGEGKTLNSIGVVYQSLGQYPRALEQFQQALAIHREIGDLMGEGTTLNNIGLIYLDLGQYVQALELFQQALAIHREIGDRAGEGISLGNIGTVYNHLGQYAQALEQYQLSLVILREIGDRAGEGGILNNIGEIYDNLGQYEQALEQYQQALAISHEVGDRTGAGTVLNNIGAVYDSLGQYEQALEQYQQALAISREVGNRAGEGTTLNNIGEAYRNLGQYAQALEQYQQALIIRREIGDRAGEGATLNNIGSAYRSLGQYQQALEQYQQSLTIQHEIGDRTGEGTTLSNIGGVYRSLGQYPQALAQYQQALAISREIGDRAGEGTVLNNIGSVYDNLGQYEQALEQYQQALAISREIGDREGGGTALNNMGVIYDRLEQYQEALVHYRQALTISREISDRQGEGILLNNIANIYNNLRRYPQALEHYQQALTISREIGNHSIEGRILNGIGAVYDYLDQHQQAAEYYQEAVTTNRVVSDRAGEGTTLNNLGASFLETNEFAKAEDTLLAAIAVLESLRDSDLSDADKIAIFETQQSTYKALQQALIAQDSPEKILRALEISERGRARAFVELVAAQLPEQQAEAFSVDAINVAAIQAIAHQENATLVQYSVVNTEVGAFLYIWVIPPAGQIQFQSVNLADLDVPLSQLVTDSRVAIGVRGRDPGTVIAVPTQAALERHRAEIRQNLQQLYRLLIEPIAAYLPTNPTDRVVLMPQGELFLVPFPALIDPNGDYLIQHHTLLTAPSIQALGLTQELRQSHHAATIRSLTASDVLVVGNPTMPEVWDPTTSRSQQLPSLPGAETEAMAIADLLGTKPLLSDAATESTVRQRMSTARVIHLATHGLLEYGNPQDSGVRDFPGAIALAPSPGRLALAPTGENDGLLTAGEILGMQLQAELVVLSACDTGRGRITGDGVIGLSRSLIQAGVPSVMVSLWSVPDAPTAALMSEFYRQWEQQPDKSQALRQAMLTIMQTHPAPLDWAAFTLIGEAE